MWRKLSIVVIALFIAGWGIGFLEKDLTRELRSHDLIPARVNLEAREKLGQTGYAVALGGLRSLIAALINLKTFNSHYAYQEWYELEKNYELITSLSPHVSYYWEAAFWHMGYNAYSDYRDKPGIPPLRRKHIQKQFFHKATSFAHKGIRLNPENWRLWRELGLLYGNDNKLPDYQKSADAYQQALEIPGSPQYLKRAQLYSLIKLPEKQKEAWKLLQSIKSTDPRQGAFPTIKVLSLLLQDKYQKPELRESILDLFETKEQALQTLRLYQQRNWDTFSRKNLNQIIRRLESPIPLR